jgi:hypothetical protein
MYFGQIAAAKIAIAKCYFFEKKILAIYMEQKCD